MSESNSLMMVLIILVAEIGVIEIVNKL